MAYPIFFFKHTYQVPTLHFFGTHTEYYRAYQLLNVLRGISTYMIYGQSTTVTTHHFAVIFVYACYNNTIVEIIDYILIGGQ